MPSVPVPISVDGDTYTVPGTDTIEPLAVSVAYDGTNAGGDFLPCLSYYTQSGQLISRTFPASSVAAGSSAEVSFIPFVPPASGAAGGGIQFDTDNEGGWLEITTNDTLPASDTGIQIVANPGATTPGDITIESTQGALLFSAPVSGMQLSGKGVTLVNSTGGATLAMLNTFVRIRLPAGQKLQVEDHTGAAIFRVNENGALQGKTGQALTFNL